MFRKPGAGEWTHAKKWRHTEKAQKYASDYLGRDLTLPQLKVICMQKTQKNNITLLVSLK